MNLTFILKEELLWSSTESDSGHWVEKRLAKTYQVNANKKGEVAILMSNKFGFKLKALNKKKGAL